MTFRRLAYDSYGIDRSSPFSKWGLQICTRIKKKRKGKQRMIWVNLQFW